PDTYRKLIDALPPAQRRYVTLNADSNITSLMLGCDVQISCETCTTTLEGWIARKPTIELIFDRNPLLYRTEQAGLNVECESPHALPALIEQALTADAPDDLKAKRHAHLAVWCSDPKGDSSRRFAETIVAALR